MFFREFFYGCEVSNFFDGPNFYYASLVCQFEENQEMGGRDRGLLSFDRKLGLLRLVSSIGNIVPLFYGWTGRDTLAVSDCAESVRSAVFSSVPPTINQLDQVGVVESLLFDGPLSARTLFRGVFKVQMGERVLIDLKSRNIERSWVWLPEIQTRPVSINSAKSEASRLIRQLSGSFENGVPRVLPITGGYDSRLLAGVARYEKNVDLVSYTFQRGWSLESWVARKVAKHLGIPHKVFDLPAKRCYKEFARDVVRKSGGMVTGMHCHGIYCCEAELDESYRKLDRIFGYFGDPVTGAMTDDLKVGAILSSPEAVLEKYRASIFGELVNRFENEIMEDLTDCYDSFRVSGSNSNTFHEFWKIQQRQNNLITHIFSFHRTHDGVSVIAPFVNEEFVQFFLALPYEFRKNRELFKQVVCSLYPELFALRSVHYDKGSWLSRAERAFELAESSANKINQNQEWLLSPFKYEQHEKNLHNFLAGDVKNGMDLVAEAFDTPRREVAFPVWRYSSVKEYYRLASLSYLLSPEIA